MNGFIPMINTMLKQGVVVSEELISNVERNGTDKRIAILLQFASEIDSESDLKNASEKFDNIHFDLLCSLFEEPTQERDDKIIFFLEAGADPLEFNGAAFSIITMIEFFDQKAYDLLVQVTHAFLGEPIFPQEK